jgi:hypothetical protein
VSSQADTEQADLGRERAELAADIEAGADGSRPIDREARPRAREAGRAQANGERPLKAHAVTSSAPTGARRASYTGGAYVGAHVRGGRGPPPRGARRSAIRHSPRCFRDVSPVPGNTGRVGRAHRRCLHTERRCPCHVLGRSRNGVDGGRRRSLRHVSLKPANPASIFRTL